MPFPHIVLTGFMGSGKTTAGRLLAARIDWPFFDLDDIVEAQTGLSIPALFAAHGEAAFRDAEQHALASVLAGPPCILALGGGAVETPANRDALRNGTVIYLSAPFERLHSRCVADAANPARTPRPNFADADAALLRWQRRDPLYRDLATLIIDADTSTAAEVAAEIAARLRPALYPSDTAA